MSDEMTPISPPQWNQMPSYFASQYQSDPSSHISMGDDQTKVTPSATSGQTNIGDPNAGESMSPRAGVAKPARRRSRGSRKAPTTLLNASLQNFRSLVQEYTGCHTSSSQSSVVKNPRAPITLNFGPPASNEVQMVASGNQAWHQQQQQPQGQHVTVSYNNSNRYMYTSPSYSSVDNNNNDNSNNHSNSLLNVDDYDEWQ